MTRSTFAPLLVLTLGGCVADSSMESSKHTKAEAAAVLKPGMTVWDFQTFTKSAPAVVSPGKMHWMFKDGSIWTGYRENEKGEWIIIDAYTDTPP